MSANRLTNERKLSRSEQSSAARPRSASAPPPSSSLASPSAALAKHLHSMRQLYIDSTSRRKKLYANDENPDRGNWSGQFDFLLSCIGYAVGVGNVWRFPYLCYENGGAVFLIPYFAMLLLLALPLYLIEFGLGQFASEGPLTVWKCVPLMRGIGYGMMVISGIVVIYFNMLTAWTLYFLWQSFQWDVPWRHCENEWNTDNCYYREEEEACLRLGERENPQLDYLWFKRQCVNSTAPEYAGHRQAIDGELLCRQKTLQTDAIRFVYDLLNDTCVGSDSAEKFADTIKHNSESPHFWSRSLPGEEYWERNVLSVHESTGIDDIGGLKPQLVVALFFSWLLVFFCMVRGIKSAGKVVYVTATFPYVILVILLIRALTLEGASKGLEFYLVPKWEKLLEVKVWRDAASQIFFSIGVSFGGVLALASYNRFHNNCMRDAVIVSTINCFTSFFAGFAVFSVLGFLATQSGKEVSEVVASGVSLAFIAYPEAIARMPLAPMWGVLFFIMLLLLGIDSQFATLETVITGIMDQWPRLRKRKTLVVLATVLFCFLVALPICTPGGIYVFVLLNDYGAGRAVLLVALLEVSTIAYLYGGERFWEDIRMMIGRSARLSSYWIFSWTISAPLAISTILLISFMQYERPTLAGTAFPPAAEAASFLLIGSTVVLVPVLAAFEILKAPSSLSLWERARFALRPADSWGPALEKYRTGRYASPPVPLSEMHASQAKLVDSTNGSATLADSLA